MKKNYLSKWLLLLCALVVGSSAWAQTTVTDELTAADFAATTTNYKNFSNVSKTSDAVYAGNSAYNNGNIQLRSSGSTSGIVSTTSGGTVKSVTITVASGTNTIDVYGSNAAYEAASDLYDSGKQGTKVGSLSATGTVTFPNNNDYEYVGIRSKSGAVYLSKVEIVWEVSGGGGDTPTTYTVTYDANGGTGEMTDPYSPYEKDDEVTLLANTFTAPEGQMWSSWLVKDASNNEITVTNNTFTMPASNVTVTAQWQAMGNYISVSPTIQNLTTDASTPAFTINTNQDLDGDPTVFYTNSTGDVAASKPAWITEALYDGGTLLLSVSANTGAARTAYFRVEKGSVKSDVITVTQAAKKYTIEQYSSPTEAHGTITFSPESPVETGAEVTLTATPAEGYDFTADSWVFYKESGNDVVVDNSITVTDNKINMPPYDIYVNATFTAKPTYAITCVANPNAGGTIVSNETAYEGQNVTIECETNSGYRLSSIVITKTSDGSATNITPTVSGNDYTFTMPGYAVTFTATFNELYSSGTFAKYTTALTEGYYVITYGSNALKNTVSSSRFDNGTFTATNDLIRNPDASIVWYIMPNGDYWTLYNEEVEKYAAGTGSKNQGALIGSVTNMAKWSGTVSNGTFQFENLGRSNASSDSGNKWLRNNGNNGWACYASGTGGALTLYKLTTLTERTITFNGNGGTYNNETTYTQNVYDGIGATLTANQFTRSGYEFAGWNTVSNGVNGTAYANQADITVTGDDLTLYAQWNPLYSLTIDNNIDGGSVSITDDVTSALAGTTITLSSNPSTGHALDAWNVYKADDESIKVTVANNQFEMPAYNVVVSATFRELQTYTLVTNANQLVSGKHYIIASGSNGSVKAMGSQNSTYRNVVAVTANEGVVPETSGVFEFVIYGPDASGYYAIYDANYSTTGGYLYASSSSSNELKTQPDNNANGKWSISIANTGAATINAHGTTTHNLMRFNSDRFACYSSNTSITALPYLYVKNGEATPTVAVPLAAASGYATYCSPLALDLTPTENYAAWAVTNVSGENVTFTKIMGSVPAETPFILYGENYGGQNATLSAATSTPTVVTGNMLKGTLESTHVPQTVTKEDVEYTNFGLSATYGDFRKIADGGNTVPANKAYLQVPTSVITNNARLRIIFEDETTGIAENVIMRNVENENIYNLNGQRVSQPKKGGLYIVNGKKVIKN